MANYTVKAGDSLSEIAAATGSTWQQIYELNKGIIGSNPNLIKVGQVLALPGSATSSGSGQGTPSSPTPTGWVGTKNDLVNVPEPAQAQIWYESKTKKFYIAWQVPGSKPPTPLIYEVEDPKALTAPGVALKADFTGTWADFNRRGALLAGVDAEIENRTEHPFIAWASQVERQAEVRPYLRDAEVLGLLMEGLLEGRPVDAAEFQTTDWWQSHNEAERRWLVLSESDPQEASRQRQANQIVVQDALKQAGVNNASQSLIGFMGDQLTSGHWDGVYLANQIKAITDPYARIAIDPDLKNQMSSGMDVTHDQEAEVRDTVRRWLGPTFGKWNQNQIQEWAGKLRNDPDAADALEAMLSKQRLAILPGYEDASLSYDDIAQPWRNLVFSEWGQVADENDPMFHQILRLNDATEAGKVLRREGLNKGVGKVVQDLQSALGQAVGGGVRPSIG